jgi:ribonuclease BN (tRNA processing enzyme)
MADGTEAGLVKLTVEYDKKKLELVGQSVGGTRTSIHVPSMRITLDAGFFPRAAAPARSLFLTHGHIDHAGAFFFLPADVSQNKAVSHFRGGTGVPSPSSVPLVVAPEQLLGRIRRIWSDVCVMNSHERGNPDAVDYDDLDSFDASAGVAGGSFELCGVPTDTVSELVPVRAKGPPLVVRSYPVDHGVPAVAYCFFERRTQLRADLQERLAAGTMERSEIGRLVKAGECVTSDALTPVLAYSGDTAISGVLRHEALLTVPVLLIECTYLGSEQTPEDAEARGHVHADQIGEHADCFRNRVIVLIHFSRRYSRDDILAARDRLRVVFAGRVAVEAFI